MKTTSLEMIARAAEILKNAGNWPESVQDAVAARLRSTLDDECVLDVEARCRGCMVETSEDESSCESCKEAVR